MWARNDRPIQSTVQATAKKRHWKAWKRTKRFLLNGSSTRNTIAGMIVTYARAPATLSVSPAAGDVTGFTLWPPAHFGQVPPSTICVPQVGQKATRPPLRDERHVIRSAAEVQWRRFSGCATVFLCPMATYPTIISSTDFKCHGAGNSLRYSRCLKGSDDHYCFGTTAVGHIADDADAGCGRAAGSLRRRAPSRHRQPQRLPRMGAHQAASEGSQSDCRGRGQGGEGHFATDSVAADGPRVPHRVHAASV